MTNKLCWRLGLIAGASVGVLIGLLHGTVCCGSPPVPVPVAQLILAGLIVALIAVFAAAAFACFVKHLSVGPVFALASLIGIVVGVLLGPLAYVIPDPGLALFVCAVLGAVLAWVVCRLLCGPRGALLDVSR
jgi:hypothetical protein